MQMRYHFTYEETKIFQNSMKYQLPSVANPLGLDLLCEEANWMG